MLDSEFAPWNTHTLTSDGELERWNAENSRHMRFLAYPVPPGWIPFKKYIVTVEAAHRFQFITDMNGVELLQFEAVTNVEQGGSGHVPYADAFTMRQIWTVRPVPDDGHSRGTVCELHVTAECNFIGRAPLVAPLISMKALAGHSEGTAGWLNGARACLDQHEKDAPTGGNVGIYDVGASGCDGNNCGKLIFSRRYAWLMLSLVCMLGITLRYSARYL